MTEKESIWNQRDHDPKRSSTAKNYEFNISVVVLDQKFEQLPNLLHPQQTNLLFEM